MLGSNSCHDLDKILGKNLSLQNLSKTSAKILSRFFLGKILRIIMEISINIIARGDAPYKILH